MLVKAGMTVKQAITYNMVSAVIAFLGMIVGIFIGSNESSIVWVLALTAGMFLYISLVDMVSISKLCARYVTTFLFSMGIVFPTWKALTTSLARLKVEHQKRSVRYAV